MVQLWLPMGEPNFWEPQMGLLRVPRALWACSRARGWGLGRKEELVLTGGIKGLVRGLLGPLLP